jgi:hypothetical protein
MHPRVLHLHNHGQHVRALQELLNRAGAGLAVDGLFGPLTERAVRAAQRRAGLFPADGLAGPRTLAALTRGGGSAPSRHPSPSNGAAHPTPSHAAGADLGAIGQHAAAAMASAVDVIERWIAGATEAPTPIPPVLKHAIEPARGKAMTRPAPPEQVSDSRTMVLSEQGRAFVFRHEAGNGRATAHLHHPTDGSGVTIGPGYDMGARSSEDVAQDLIAAGVDPASATAASKGAGLYSTKAETFARENKGLLNLTLAQQVLLQRQYKGAYERKVRNGVTIPLHQYEFDALVSYAGNPGSSHGWLTTVALVNQQRRPEAMAEIKKFVYSKKSGRVQGLVNRRDAEAKLFLYGDYSA